MNLDKLRRQRVRGCSVARHFTGITLIKGILVPKIRKKVELKRRKHRKAKIVRKTPTIRMGYLKMVSGIRKTFKSARQSFEG